MRQDVVFQVPDGDDQLALNYAATHEEWPMHQSIGAVNGKAILVLSKGAIKSDVDSTRER